MILEKFHLTPRSESSIRLTSTASDNFRKLEVETDNPIVLFMEKTFSYDNPDKVLSGPEVEALERLLDKYQGQKGALLPVLIEAQNICGNWLPRNVLDMISKRLNIHLSYVYGVITFYTMLSIKPRGKYIIRVCESTTCHVMGAENLIDVLEEILGIKVGETTKDGLFTLERSSCLGVCEIAPAMQINEVVFGNLTRQKIGETLAMYREGKPIDYRKLSRSAGTISKEIDLHRERILLNNIDEVDPSSIDDYIKRGGYTALEKALKRMSPVDVLNEVKASGLRGRGGAGFPAGVKWSFTQPLQTEKKYVICNADEGEPGTIKDRYIMEGDPHRVIEGMIITGYAVGACRGYIYCRGEYYLSMLRLNTAINQARERGFLGENILGSGFSYDIELRSGAGAYVCGEETGLIESIEGFRGNPRFKPPFPGVQGLWRYPTVVNNVETLCNVPSIINRGGEWYKSLGTEDAPGVKLYQIVGHVKKPQVVEAPLGLTLRELIFKYGGGMKDDKPFKMCQTGGASFGFFTEEHLDTPMDYTSMQKQGGALGSGTMLVMNNETCVVDVVRTILYFFQHESCGFCTPCRRGTRVLYDTISAIARGDGKESDLEMMIDLANTMSATANCALAMSPIFFVKTTIERFRDEYLEHITKKACPLGACRIE